MSSPLFNDNVSPHLSLGTTPIQTHGPCKSSNIGIVHKTIDVLPDDIFLEIFALCLHTSGPPPQSYWDHMREWRRLVQVCQRWRQIIYASSRYLDLLIYCSKYSGTPVGKSLSCWPAFPIAMSYSVPDDNDATIAILKHPDRVRLVDLRMESSGSQWGKVVAAMQEPFPVLTYLKLTGYPHLPVLPSGLLGGSAPCLQQVYLSKVPYPQLPTLLLSARGLVSLQVTSIPPTGYISPDAMVASLAVLTKLKSLCIRFSSWIYPLDQKRTHPDPSMRAVLPALTDFEFAGSSEYLEDLVAQMDAPRLNGIRTYLPHLDFNQVPNLFIFVGRTENLRFRRVAVEFQTELKIELRVDRCRPGSGEPETARPHFSLCIYDPSSTHIAHVALVLSQIFTMCSSVELLHIIADEYDPGWGNHIDNAEWLAFFRPFTTVETLFVSGGLAGQVARALEDIPERIVAEVLPSLHLLLLRNPNYILEYTEQFISLRQLHGCPVTIPTPLGYFEILQV